MTGFRRNISIVTAIFAVFSLVGVNLRTWSPSSAQTANDAAWISFTIKNGKAEGTLDLVAGQAYVFQRIALIVENASIDESRALDWLRQQSAFAALDWSGVRNGPAFWHNYRESRPDADLYSRVFDGAAWYREDNELELTVLGDDGSRLGSPVRLKNTDFLNRQKQQDFDMVKAEYRYERLTRHKDLTSAQTQRAVAKIVFAVQTELSKQLVIPASARSLRVVWNKKPHEPYLFPIRLVAPAYNYGGRLQVKLEPDKAVYSPGDVIRATFSLVDQKGKLLKFSEFAKNGIRQINIHLDGPVQEPTFYHEEWLSEFGKRNAHHFRAPALGLGTADGSVNTALDGPPLDSDGANMVVDLHVPKDLPKDKLGTFEIGATVWRNYASQTWADRLEHHIQVGQEAKTHFETFGCENCHTPDTPMDVGLLIPPMVGIEKLKVASIESCVMCHDNSRNGSRRLNKYLHLIHLNREAFPRDANNCRLCHLSDARLSKGEYP